MWKKLLAVVVAAVVITGGVLLFRARHQLFRPDADRVGGTEIVYELTEPAGDDDMDRACEVLRKRFDDDGSAGVIVRRDGDKRLALVVPNGRRHDEIAGLARRLAHRRGRVEFRLLAQEKDDKAALNQARLWFLDKKNPLPAKKEDTAGGRELVMVGAGTKERYRWFRFSESASRSGGGGRSVATPVGGGVGGSGREVTLSPWNVTMYVAHAPGGGPSEYFVLCREPHESERIGNEQIQRVRMAYKDPRQMGGIEFTFDADTARRLLALSPMVAGGHPRAVSLETGMLGGILDGEVVLVHHLYQPVRRKQVFSLVALPTEVEELTVLMRGGELPVKLADTPAAERTLAPRR